LELNHVNARYEEIPLTVEEYMLLRLRHVSNKDACPKCDGLAVIAREPQALPYPTKAIVPCPCRTIGPRRFIVLKTCCPGNVEVHAGETVLVYGWPHTGGRLTFTVESSGSTFDGGWPSAFRDFLKQGNFRFIDTGNIDLSLPCNANPAP
jgi:hypothetical protein